MVPFFYPEPHFFNYETNTMLALQKMAERLDLQPAELKSTLRKTVFAACKTDEEFAALVVVCQTYGLNPVLKEIFAFPAKGGGIVPMVSIDGWIRIINDHPQMDGMAVEMAADGKSCTVTIHRKDRKHPTVVTEYLAECRRETDPWKMMPLRMLRHKAIKEAGRVAFGFGGIHDDDEAQEIAMKPAKGRVVESEPEIDPRIALRPQLMELARANGVALKDLVGIARKAGLTLDDGKLSGEAMQAMVSDFAKFVTVEEEEEEVELL